MYPVDIGETGPWGRPVDASKWDRFYRYPLAIWDEPFFRHPDVVLIDGRFRTACFAACVMRITRPTTVLMDDYGVREKYQMVEKIVKPDFMVGRMAHFSLTPGMARAEEMGFLISQFFVATFVGNREKDYRVLTGPTKVAE